MTVCYVPDTGNGAEPRRSSFCGLVATSRVIRRSREMAIFSFQTEGGIGATPDPVEVELDSLRDAQLEAVGFMGEALKDRPAKFWDHHEASVTVSDDTGLVLFTLTLSATLAPVLQPPKPI